MEAKAILKPRGIGYILTNEWVLRRIATCTVFNNGGLAYSTGGAIPAVPKDDTSGGPFQSLNPVSGDIFDIDVPGCPFGYGTNINYTAEGYCNFWEHLEVYIGANFLSCSPTNTFSYEAVIDTNATPQVRTNLLSTNLISIPTNSVFSPR